MIIIVEGPDGAGKTTRIEQLLVAHPGSTYTHFDNHDRSIEVFANAIKSINPTKVNIFDRSWYSEYIYGPIFRNQSEISSLNIELLEALVYKNGGGFVIYCTAPIRLLWRRCQLRGEKFVLSEEKLDEIRVSYEHVMKQDCHLPVIRIDTSAKWYA